MCKFSCKLGAAERSPEDNDDKYLDYLYECEEVSLTDRQLISVNHQYLSPGLYLCAIGRGFKAYLHPAGGSVISVKTRAY